MKTENTSNIQVKVTISGLDQVTTASSDSCSELDHPLLPFDARWDYIGSQPSLPTAIGSLEEEIEAALESDVAMVDLLNKLHSDAASVADDALQELASEIEVVTILRRNSAADAAMHFRELAHKLAQFTICTEDCASTTERS